mgnify:CR=1 FL=1
MIGEVVGVALGHPTGLVGLAMVVAGLVLLAVATLRVCRSSRSGRHRRRVLPVNDPTLVMPELADATELFPLPGQVRRGWGG